MTYPLKSYTKEQIEEFIKYLKRVKENIISIRIENACGEEKVISLYNCENNSYFQKYLEQMLEEPIYRILSHNANGKLDDITNYLASSQAPSIFRPQQEEYLAKSNGSKR